MSSFAPSPPLHSPPPPLPPSPPPPPPLPPPLYRADEDEGVQDPPQCIPLAELQRGVNSSSSRYVPVQTSRRNCVVPTLSLRPAALCTGKVAGFAAGIWTNAILPSWTPSPPGRAGTKERAQSNHGHKSVDQKQEPLRHGQGRNGYSPNEEDPKAAGQETKTIRATPKSKSFLTLVPALREKEDIGLFSEIERAVRSKGREKHKRGARKRGNGGRRMREKRGWTGKGGGRRGKGTRGRREGKGQWTEEG